MCILKIDWPCVFHVSIMLLVTYVRIVPLSDIDHCSGALSCLFLIRCQGHLVRWGSAYILGYHNPYPHVLEVEWMVGHQISILLAMTPATR